MIQIPVAGLKKNSGINIPIAGLPVAPALPNTNLGLPPIGGVRTTTPVVMPEGVPSLLQFAKKLPETLLPATTEFAKTTGAIFGEGLAYLVDPIVREQYQKGNLDILPLITKTSLGDYHRNNFDSFCSYINRKPSFNFQGNRLLELGRILLAE